MNTDQKLHIHLISDATGETALHLAKASLIQFEEAQFVEHLWSLVRTEEHLRRIIPVIEANPGVVIYTVVDENLQRLLQNICQEKGIPCVGVLDPVLNKLSELLESKPQKKPGKQYIINDDYLKRLSAVDFTLEHDDGQQMDDLDDADVILLGVSRTSKTPTCLYLAHHGLRAANIPIFPELNFPEKIFKLEKPLIVGLTVDVERLMRMRHNRLLAKSGMRQDYVNPERVQQEVYHAQKLYRKHKLPVIDMTYRSIEETAASVMSFYYKKKGLIV